MSTSTMETFQISWMYSRNHCFKINDVWFINIIQLILELPRDEGVCIVQHENRTSLLKKPTEVLAKKKWLHFASVLRGMGRTTRANS